MAKKTSLRMCVLCRQMLPKRDLLRIIKSEEGNFLPDKAGKAQGRGFYICHSEQCRVALTQTKYMRKAFKANLSEEECRVFMEALAATEAAEHIGAEQEKAANKPKLRIVTAADMAVQHKQKLMRLIGLARRSGQLVPGAIAIEKAIEADDVVMLFIAQDAGENTINKFSVLCERNSVAYDKILTTSELEQLMNRAPLALLAVRRGSLGTEIAACARDLSAGKEKSATALNLDND